MHQLAQRRACGLTGITRRGFIRPRLAAPRKICFSICPFFGTLVSSSIASRGPRLRPQTQFNRGCSSGFGLRAQQLGTVA